MFLWFKFKPFVAFVCIIFMIFCCTYFLIHSISSVNATPKYDFTVVLDAGHGGMDGGCEGKTGVKESDLNLKIVKKLAKYFLSFGFNVVLTRYDENGLYNVFGRDYKQQDMEKRKEIILSSNANLLVSIHLNSYPSSTLRGAQAFYDESSESGKLLADCIEQELYNTIEYAKQNSHLGDYYILKCTQNPSVMVECGYLSNSEEETLLVSDMYQQNMAYHIFCGVVKYFQSSI